MTFNSLDFMLFFAAVFTLYYLLPYRLRNGLLLLASYVFYAAYDLPLALFLVISTLFNYIMAVPIGRRKSKMLMILGVAVNLGSLGFFKYRRFFLQILSGITGVRESDTFKILTPLGISFITFTAVSYLVDVYRQEIPAERNLLKFSLFMSFFPKVVQGPIERAGDLLPQFDEEHRFDLLRFREGMMMMLYGLFMKMVVADRAAIPVDQVFGNLKTYPGSTIVMATLFFTLQLYCDFVGYTYTAIGAARVLGYDFRPNFCQPYLSLSVSDFWRRWHMSLNRWLTRYVYIPLGGSRCSNARRIFNVMVTFGISGLWHGDDWGYVIWGLLNGLYVSVETTIQRLTGRKEKAEQAVRRGPAGLILKGLRWLLTFVLIVFTWLFFRARTLDASLLALRKIFTKFHAKAFIALLAERLPERAGTTIFGLDVRYDLLPLLLGIVIMIIVDRIESKGDIARSLARGKRLYRWTLAFCLIFGIILFGVYGYGYSASAFIYTGF